MLSSGKASLSAFMGIQQENCEPDITVSDGSEIILGETKIKVLATPGHTKGGVCYLLDDCIFTGDTLFSAPAAERIFPAVHQRRLCRA